MPLSNRYYLSDAVFLAGVEGDAELIQFLDQAVRRPKFPLYLGRRSCPPCVPVSLGVREDDLLTALRQEPGSRPRGTVRKGSLLELRLLSIGLM